MQLGIEALPFSYSLTEESAMFVGGFLNGNSYAFFKGLRVMEAYAYFLVDVTSGLSERVIFFRGLYDVRSTGLLILISLDTVSARMCRVVCVIIGGIDCGFFAFEAEGQAFARFIIFDARDISLAVRIIRRYVVRQLRRFRVDFARFRYRADTRLSSAIDRIMREGAIGLFIRR